MGDSDSDRNRELAQFKSNESERTFDDVPLLSGESFSVKSHWLYKMVGWLGLCFSIKDVVDMVREGIFDWSFASVYGGMIIMCIFLLILARSSVYIDKQSIIIVRAFGRYQIKWDEMEKIVFDTRLRKIIFYGRDKWLVMPKIVPYASGRRFGVADYVNAQVQLRKIPVEFSDKTPNRSKNTLISFF